MKMKNKATWAGIAVLIAIEQVIKIIINNNYLDRSTPILPPFLYFEPMFNRSYSWFNSMFELGVSKWLHIILTGAMIAFLYLFYKFLNNKYGYSRLINVMFAFIFSGAMCSMIDKVFWNGSLDYILVKGFFTFDLKDVYLNVFNGLLILSLFTKSEALKKLDDRSVLRDFGRFILRRP